MKEELLNNAAQSYRLNCYYTSESVDFDDIDDAFQQGARWHESLPLAERLSESEKENIRNEYKKAYSEAFAETTCLDRQYARGRYQVLREIFGKNLFTPTEQ